MQLYPTERAGTLINRVIMAAAIVVLLAAFAWVFVLGHGSPARTPWPVANFQFDFDPGADGGFGTGGDDTVIITHTAGERIEPETLTVEGGHAGGGSWSVGGDGVVSERDSYTKSGANLTPGAQVRVVWTDPNEDSTRTIGESEVPA